MNKIILVLAIIVILVVAVGAYFIFYGSQSLPYGTATPNNTNPQSNQPSSLSASVSIQNFAFNPTPLTVKSGATVTWTNNDTAPHQIKSDTFNSAVLSTGQTFSFTFSAVGEYNYSCAIHSSMLGKIIVTQ